MDRLKSGKFIQELRREKKLTQQELADKLGVTDKSIGNWENGRNMPDVSLFKPLCEILDITINELISGERISKDKYQEKFEENIYNTIDYSRKKFNKTNLIFGHVLLAFGQFLAWSSIMLFSSGNIYCSIYVLFGITLFAIGIFHITYKMAIRKRSIIALLIFLISSSLFIAIDYMSVRLDGTAPMFKKYDKHISTDFDEIFYYNNIFFDVIKCNNKSTTVENKKYTDEELIEYCLKQE